LRAAAHKSIIIVTPFQIKISDSQQIRSGEKVDPGYLINGLAGSGLRAKPKHPSCGIWDFRKENELRTGLQPG
jgi:hypothetical protein